MEAKIGSAIGSFNLEKSKSSRFDSIKRVLPFFRKKKSIYEEYDCMLKYIQKNTVKFYKTDIWAMNKKWKFGETKTSSTITPKTQKQKFKRIETKYDSINTTII